MIVIDETTDIRPCDVCGTDYEFTIGEDTGQCPTCHRALVAASLAAQRQRERIRAAIRERGPHAQHTWVLYQSRHPSRPARWHLLVGTATDDTPLAVCECRLDIARIVEPRPGEGRCIHCAAYARRCSIPGPDEVLAGLPQPREPDAA